MAVPTPSSGEEQPDTDAGFRHRPSPNPPGDIAPDRTQPTGRAGGGPAWPDPGGTSVLRGGAKAGGPDPRSPHLFHLADAPANVFDGGGLQGAHGQNWPVLRDQNGAVYIARLEPGGFREPHWHPSAWEMNFVIQGRVRWTFVGPNATEDSFEAEKGDLVFAPQGHFHYFENASDTEDLVVLIVFNSSATEPDDDVGIVHALSAMPPEVMAAAFGAPLEVFRNLPEKHGRVVIGRRQGGE